MKHRDNLTTRLTHFYEQHARSLPWRVLNDMGAIDAYGVLVSEFMLQQTQVSRVVPKYQHFKERFPTIDTLAHAQLSEVLIAWSGLGYNRRARYLWEAARILQNTPHPWKIEELTLLKGIGVNTAAAIVAYSYNQPVVFVETNIRTVIIHHYFSDADRVTDKQIIDTLTAIVPWSNGSKTTPRDFYWSLMDYGTHLKSTTGNSSQKSATYKKQAAFKGSKRQIRGEIIRSLAEDKREFSYFQERINDSRLPGIVEDLQAEGLIRMTGNTLMLYNEENY